MESPILPDLLFRPDDCGIEKFIKETPSVVGLTGSTKVVVTQAGYVLDSGGYGLGVFLVRAETLARLPAAGRRRPAQFRGTAPPE